MRHPRQLVSLLALLTLLLTGGCDVLGLSPDTGEVAPGRIAFVGAGGIGGGILDSLTITSEGLATYYIPSPNLQLQLSDDEHQRILALFDGFFSLDDPSDGTPCADDIRYTVEYQTGERSKRVSAWGCVLFHDDDGGHADPGQLGTIVRELRALEQRVYKKTAPWRGIEATFTTDQALYEVGESITVQTRLRNPTSGRRTLVFPYKSTYALAFYNSAYHTLYRHSDGPEGRIEERPGPPLRVPLAPGQDTVLAHTWDQRVNIESLTEDDAPHQTLPPGRYGVNMKVRDRGSGFGDRPGGIGHADTIHVVDPDVPLSGHVVADGDGSASIFTTYTVKLYVENWTSQPVTLRFPKRQRLHVTLYEVPSHDEDAPPFQRVFESEEEPAADVSSVTLAPGASRVFERTFDKADLPLPLVEHLALVQVELLEEDVDFSRRHRSVIAPYSEE